ncbi:MAG: hypothetical protein ABI355_17680 [Solirubrobacteraceae bacterium]
MRSRIRGSLVLLSCAAVTCGALLVSGAQATSSLRHPAAADAIATTPGTALFAAPGNGTLLTSQVVRVVVRAPRGTRLVVRLNGRDVSRHFGNRAGLRSAILVPRDGLRLGDNQLFAVALRGRRQVGIQARLFVVARNAGKLAVTKVGAAALPHGLLGAPAPVGVPVSVSAGAGVGPGLLGGSPRDLAARLRSARTPRVFRASLNGHDVTRFFTAPQRADWMASLSASHGLRFGANRVSTMVLDPHAGRYVSSTQIVTVSRSRPLAAAGRDQLVARGARVRLDGGRSLVTRRGMGLRYRWRLVLTPPGSHARLDAATSRRPLLVPDLPGVYRVDLAVTQVRMGTSARRGSVAGVAAGTGAGTAAVGATSTPDQVQITAQPPTPFIDGVDTQATDGHGHPGIQIGPSFYPNPSPGGTATQVLTLDRTTLQPTGPGNAYTDGTDDPQTGVAALLGQIQGEGTGQLVIIAQPDTAHVPIAPGSTQPARIQAFNQIVNLLGGAGFATADLSASTTALSVIGVPYADANSGWQKTDALRGSFTLSGGNYAFSPTYYRFKTASETSAYDHTMSFPDLPSGDSEPNVQFNAGAAGFHVVILDHDSLRVRANQFAELDHQYGPTQGGLTLLHSLLTQAIGSGDIVFVQSVGTINPVGLDPNFGPAWNRVAQDMVSLGANLGVFNGINGSYAFIGAAGLPPSEVAEVSSAVPGQPNPAQLQGYLAVDRQGRYHAVLPDATGAANLDLYKLIHQPATPWPYTTGPDAAGYGAALQYITNQLGFSKYGPDIRAAYYLDDNFDFTTEDSQLAGLSYPGGNPGFTSTELDNLKVELPNEFALLKQAKDLFDSYKEPFLRAQGGEQTDLQTLAAQIYTALKPSASANVAFTIVSALVNGALLVVAPYTEPLAQAVIGAVTTAVSLAGPLADAADGSPAPDLVQAKAAQFSATVGSSYAANATAMDALRDVTISDYGKLTAAATDSKDPRWAASSTTIANTTSRLQLAARQSFYGGLLSAAFPQVQYMSTLNPDPKFGPGECFSDFDHLPRTAWTRILGALPGNQFSQTLPEYQIWSFEVFESGLFSTIQVSQAVSDAIATPSDQHTVEPNPADDQPGLGLYLPWFMSRNFVFASPNDDPSHLCG